MSKTRFLPSFFLPSDNDDSATLITRITTSARERRYFLRNEAKLIREWIADNCIRGYGCDCGSCQAGYDCCGNTFVYFYQLKPARHGVHLIARTARNI